MRDSAGIAGGFLMAFGLLISRTAGADDGVRKDQPSPERNEPASAASDQDSLRDPPSLRETGRVGSTKMKTQGFPIDDSRAVTPDPSETAVTPLDTDDDDPGAAAAASTGHVDPAVLEPEIDARMAGARVCRLEIARRKRVAPAQVRAQTLELRWVILPSGRVAARQVVATSPVDPDVMTCVKRRMGSWTFTAPTGGPLALDRNLVFK